MSNRKTIQDLSLIDDFLFTEIMSHKEMAQETAKIIIERVTGLKADNLIIEPQKVLNGIDTESHGIRMDVAITQINESREKAEIIRFFDIEPNNRKSVNLAKQSRYYQALDDIKLLETGVDYDKLPELWTIWILPYDPFGKNHMIYFVKNVVEGFDEIDYNDGVRKVFLYAGGECGGSEKLKSLLSYIRNSSEENATDNELQQLHASVEHLRKNREIGVKYMRMQDFLRYERLDARREGFEEGQEEGREKGRQEGREKMSQLTRVLLEEKRYDDLKRATEDEAYCQELFRQYGILKDK